MMVLFQLIHAFTTGKRNAFYRQSRHSSIQNQLISVIWLTKILFKEESKLSCSSRASNWKGNSKTVFILDAQPNSYLCETWLLTDGDKLYITFTYLSLILGSELFFIQNKWKNSFSQFKILLVCTQV